MKTIIYLFLLFAFSPLAMIAQHGGSALNFASGTEDRVMIPDNPDGDLDINSGFTVEAWFKHDNDPNLEDAKKQ